MLLNPFRFGPSSGVPAGIGFGDIGFKTIPEAGISDSLMSLLVKRDKKVVVGGVTNSIDEKLQSYIFRYNADATLDSSFGDAGKAIISTPDNIALLALAQQSDGKMIGLFCSGVFPECNFILMRILDDGSIDDSFNGGTRIVAAGIIDNINVSLNILPDDRILVTTEHFNIDIGHYKILTKRYLPDGTKDTAFATSGELVVVDLDADLYLNLIETVITPNGRIIVSYRFESIENPILALRKYNESGAVTSSFGTAGLVEREVGYNRIAITPLLDNRILLSGWLFYPEGNATICLTANGDIDTTFASDFSSGDPGVLVYPPETYYLLTSLQSNGKIIASFSIGEARYMFRLLTDGNIDITFADGGFLYYSGVNELQTDFLKIGADNKIATAFTRNNPENPEVSQYLDSDVRRYTSNGMIDAKRTPNGFGEGGVAESPNTDDSYIFDNTVFIHPNGKVVTLTTYIDVETGSSTSVIRRYASDGSLDTSFGIEGEIVITTSGFYNQLMVRSIDIYPDGKILVLGVKAHDDDEESVVGFLRRYNEDGSLDTDFGTDGEVDASFTGTGTFLMSLSVKIGSFGDIFVLGVVIDTNPITAGQYHVLANYYYTGSLNTDFGVAGYKKFNRLTTGSDPLGVLSIQADGNLLVACNNYTDEGLESRVYRFFPDGNADAIFGDDGLFSNSVYASPLAIALQSNGILIGYLGLILNIGPEGFVNLGFGDEGYVRPLPDDFDIEFGTIEWGTIVKQQNGKIVYTGYYSGGMVLSRLNRTGSLDTSFGTDGLVIIPNTVDKFNEVYGLTIQLDGKIIISGISYETGYLHPKAFVARFLENGILDA